MYKVLCNKPTRVEVTVPERMRDRYNLCSIDGVYNRNRELKTNEQRLRLLKAFVSTCNSCYADFAPGDYSRVLTRSESLNERRTRTFFLDPTRPVFCRLCRRLLFQPKCRCDPSCRCSPRRPSGRASLVQIGGYDNDKCRCLPRCTCTASELTVLKSRQLYRNNRIALRLLWRILTLNGLVVSVYTFFVDRVGFAALGLGLALFYNMNDQAVSMYNVFVNSNGTHANATGPAVARSNEITSDTVEKWMINIGILVLLVLILKFLKLLEIVGNYAMYGFSSSQSQRLKRSRFNEITAQAEATDRHAFDYSYEYFSDDEFEGFNDPDIAYVNLSEPSYPSCLRRCRRRVFLV